MPKTVRFDQIKLLTADTRVLGATAAEWDAIFTGKMHQKLQQVKRLVESGAKHDTSLAGSDVVTTVSAKRP